MTNAAVAEKFDVNQATVRKRRKRFIDSGVDALCDELQPGVPRKFGDGAIEALVVKTVNSNGRCTVRS